jgi:TM2 domain-containing membrane protein YozV
MSQGQDWTAPGAQEYQQQPPSQQPSFGQAYQQQPPSQQPSFGQAYQQPQGQNGYPPAPYQQPYPPAYAAPLGMQVVPKNAGIALLISFFIPGVGSLYAGKTSTGVIILIGYIISWVLTIVIIGFVGVFGFWVWGMIDAYQAAQSWNRARGIES